MKYISFLDSVIMMAEGMIGVIAVVADIYGAVELLMHIFKNKAKDNS